MKHSVFWKIILGLLIFVSISEGIFLFFLYRYTYNEAVEHATSNIKYAASMSALAFEAFDADDVNKKGEGASFLNDLCQGLNITYLYIVKPDVETKSELYLVTGYGEDASDEFKYNRYPGYLAEGKLRNEQIRALNGESEVMLHEVNQYDDTLICYTPVKRYYSSKTQSYVNKIENIVCAEVSVTSIMKDFNNSYNRLIIHIISITLLFMFLTVVILYFRVSKPLKLISKRMKEFVSQRDKGFEKLPVKGKDELAEMSDSFNTMAEEIDRYISDLSEMNLQKAELNIARTIQMGLLEPESFCNENFSLSVSMMTAKDVGGDLYDYHVLENGKVFVTIGDVSGKGITAAMFMSRAITLLNQYARLGYSPGRILYEYNNSLAEHNPKMMFITTFVAVYDPETGELTYSNAGHNYPFILSDTLKVLDGKHGPASGIFKDSEYPEHSVKMKNGDMLYMYTDGVTEAQNKNGSFFEEEKLQKLLNDNRGSEPENLLKTILDEIHTFADGAEQADDITMLSLKIRDKNTNRICVEAKKENLAEINKLLNSLDVSDELRFQLDLIAEEVFVNICSYSYPGTTGSVEFEVEVDDNDVIMTFTDSGIPFDSSKDIINIDEYDKERAVGGLGRFLVFSVADDHSYQRVKDKNVLKLIKHIAT